MTNNAEHRHSRWPWGLLAVAYLVFTVYGSLVPLDYRPIPWGQALENFRSIPFLKLGIGSRADWVANLLLFVPFGFLWLGWLWSASRVGRILVSLLVLILAVALCFGIEFTQLFFPPRTVSQNDILAESVGALIGIGLWWWLGPALRNWIRGWREARGAANVAEYLLWIYLAGLLVYNVLPLDLTISPVEIYHKWKNGGVNFIPFAYPTESLAMLVYGTATDVIIWSPVAALWIISGRRTPIQAFWWTWGTVLLIELVQFFVYSRVSDVTDLITGAGGAGIGVLVGSWLRPGFNPRGRTTVDIGEEGAARQGMAIGSGPGSLPWVLLAILGWIGVLGLVFWYPFDFDTDRAFLRERLHLLLQVPFRNYYYGTEFRAVTELFHKLLFFAPLGALLALGRLQIGRFSPLRHLYDGFALLLILGIPMLIELGQVALPSKHPDSTDWLLEAIGAAGGYLLVIMVRNKMLLAARPRREARRLTDEDTLSN